jgi:putative thioredoxin
MAVEVTDETFEKEVIQKSHEIPVLVDFWASWCGPCMMLKPILEKIAQEYKGKFIFAKFSVEQNQKVASELGIMSIPVVKLYKNGSEVDGFIGMKPETMIKEWLDQKL